MTSAPVEAESGEYALKEEPLENLRPLKVRVIGAGYSGIYAAIRCDVLPGASEEIRQVLTDSSESPRS